jgi:hypothetical protein
MFETELRLTHNSRLCEKATSVINSIRSGVLHIVGELEANKKMLVNVPASNPPKFSSDDDIVRLLSWCEERLLAINEALVLESTKPGGAGDVTSKPLSTRQTDLAAAVQIMVTKSSPKKKKLTKINRKGGASVSHTIINFAESDVLLLDPRSILVPSEDSGPGLFSAKMDVINKTRDIKYDEVEASVLHPDKTDAVPVSQFLSDALANPSAKDQLRKANFMSNKKQGRNAGFGWALEDMMRIMGPELVDEDTLLQANLSMNQQGLKPKDFEILSRGEAKERAAKILKPHQQKIAAAVDADEENLTAGGGGGAVAAAVPVSAGAPTMAGGNAESAALLPQVSA